MNCRIIASALALTASAFGAQDAQAQRYFMRAHLWPIGPDGSASSGPSTPAPTPTPAPTSTPSPAPVHSYAWERGPWSSWSSTCSATAMRSRSVVCRRDDGQLSGDAACTDDALRSELKADWSGCSNRIQYNDATLNREQYCQGTVKVVQNVWCVNRYGTPQDMSVCGAEGIPAPPATIDLPCQRNDVVTGNAFWSNGVAPGSTYRKGAYAGRLSEAEATTKALAQCNASDFIADVQNHGFCYFIGYTWVPRANVTIVEAGPKNSAPQGSVGTYDMTGSVTTTLNRFNTVSHEFVIDDRSMDAFQRRLVQCGQNFQVSSSNNYVASLRCLR